MFLKDNSLIKSESHIKEPFRIPIKIGFLSEYSYEISFATLLVYFKTYLKGMKGSN
jgi:hypothetical protein